ncbi:hypothetical protein, partial [Vibrio celticus]|uniref:hypothetical protein n=1 Tax=Vibrio celticus TaxID=446372 RepID=UPI0019D187EF
MTALPSEHFTIGPMFPLPGDWLLARALPNDKLKIAVRIIKKCLIQTPLGLSLIEINESMDKEKKISKVGAYFGAFR